MSNVSAINLGLGSEPLDQGQAKSGKTIKAVSEDSIQRGKLLPYVGKVRSTIKKVLPWSRKDGNTPDSTGKTSTGAFVGHECLGCEVVHESEGEIQAEYVPNALGKIHLDSQISCDIPE